MKCLRCGKDTPDERVFCEECAADMDRYPVNPNAPVILPKRTAAPAQKKASRKKTVTPEEQIAILKNRVRLLLILLVAMTIFAAVLIYPAVQYLMEDHVLPGQNYSSIVSKTSGASEPNK